jgi:predicted transcriptional regulator with HTH domain
MRNKVEQRKLRKKAIRLQNNLYPKKVSMSEALRLVQKGTDDA